MAMVSAAGSELYVILKLFFFPCSFSHLERVLFVVRLAVTFKTNLSGSITCVDVHDNQSVFISVWDDLCVGCGFTRGVVSLASCCFLLALLGRALYPLFPCCSPASSIIFEAVVLIMVCALLCKWLLHPRCPCGQGEGRGGGVVIGGKMVVASFVRERVVCFIFAFWLRWCQAWAFSVRVGLKAWTIELTQAEAWRRAFTCIHPYFLEGGCWGVHFKSASKLVVLGG